MVASKLVFYINYIYMKKMYKLIIIYNENETECETLIEYFDEIEDECELELEDYQDKEIRDGLIAMQMMGEA